VFSRNASNRNFETSILSKILQRSYNKAFVVDTNHQSLGARVISYSPEAFMDFYGRGGCINFRGGTFGGKLEVLVPF
jgi:hypothetical protein